MNSPVPHDFLSGSMLEEGEVGETVITPAEAGSAVPSALAGAAALSGPAPPRHSAEAVLSLVVTLRNLWRSLLTWLLPGLDLSP